MKKQKAFTLLETLVAIYVLLVGIVGAMTLTQQSIASASVFRNELIAANLAQEGIELVRNKMTSNFITATNNDDPGCIIAGVINCNVRDMVGMLGPGTSCATGCYPEFDPSAMQATITFSPCAPANAECKKLNQDPSIGIFTSTAPSGSSAVFDRRVIITPVTNGWDVLVTVSWPGRFGSTKIQERVVLAPWFY